MNDHEQIVLCFAAVAQEAAAMSDAVLAGDLDEARFRARLLMARADIAGFADVSRATAYVIAALGPTGHAPRPGYGAGILRVADAIDAARGEAL